MEEELDQQPHELMPMPGEVYEIFEQDNQMSNVSNPGTIHHLFRNQFDVSMNPPPLDSCQMLPYQQSSTPLNVHMYQKKQQQADERKNASAPIVSSINVIKPKRFRWSPDIHARFVEIINHLLTNRLKITPKSIHNHMSELSLAQIKSHLQKFRLSEQIRKQNMDVGINPRDEDAQMGIKPPPSSHPNTSRASSSTPGVVIQDALGSNEEQIVRNEKENNLMQPQPHPQPQPQLQPYESYGSSQQLQPQQQSHEFRDNSQLLQLQPLQQSYEFRDTSQLQPQQQSYEFRDTSQLQPQPQLQSYEFRDTSKSQPQLQSYEFRDTSQLQPQPKPHMQSYEFRDSSQPQPQFYEFRDTSQPQSQLQSYEFCDTSQPQPQPQPQLQSYKFGDTSQLQPQPQLQSYEFCDTSQLQPQLQSYEFRDTSPLQLQPQSQSTLQSYEIHGSSLPYSTTGGIENFGQEGSMTAVNTFPSWNPNPHSTASFDVQTPFGEFAPNHPNNEYNNYVYGGSVVGGSTAGEREDWTREPEVDPHVVAGSIVGEQGDLAREPEVDPDETYLNFNDALDSFLRDFNGS